MTDKLKIAVIGGTGMAGSAIVLEGLERGYEVTIITRNKKSAQSKFQSHSKGDLIEYLEIDAFDLNKSQLKDFDVVIDAYAPNNGQVDNHIKLAKHLNEEIANLDKPRVAYIVGSSSLINPRTGTIIAKDLYRIPDSQKVPWMFTGIAQYEEYQYLTSVKDVDWFAFSPQPMFSPGKKTKYEISDDQVINEGALSTGNAASAIFDEIEKPKYKQKKFTAANVYNTDWSQLGL